MVQCCSQTRFGSRCSRQVDGHQKKCYQHQGGSRRLEQLGGGQRFEQLGGMNLATELRPETVWGKLKDMSFQDIKNLCLVDREFNNLCKSARIWQTWGHHRTAAELYQDLMTAIQSNNKLLYLKRLYDIGISKNAFTDTDFRSWFNRKPVFDGRIWIEVNTKAPKLYKYRIIDHNEEPLGHLNINNQGGSISLSNHRLEGVPIIQGKKVFHAISLKDAGVASKYELYQRIIQATAELHYELTKERITPRDVYLEKTEFDDDGYPYTVPVKLEDPSAVSTPAASTAPVATTTTTTTPAPATTTIPATTTTTLAPAITTTSTITPATQPQLMRQQRQQQRRQRAGQSYYDVVEAIWANPMNFDVIIIDRTQNDREIARIAFVRGSRDVDAFWRIPEAERAMHDQNKMMRIARKAFREALKRQ